jgi:hypothetical protein
MRKPKEPPSTPGSSRFKKRTTFEHPHFNLPYMLEIHHDLPPEFATVHAQQIQQLFPVPTLLMLAGRRQPALFVSILLHGNEDVGLRAMQRVLAKYQGKELPRDLIIFIGNVAACTHAVRFLPHQLDFNRVWPGSELPHSSEHDLMHRVVDEVVRYGVFASLDLHNNTGRNPIYACVCDRSPQQLYLASMFSRTVVYFTRPKGVQTQAFMKHCPSITCECGQIGDEAGVERAAELVDACLHLAEFPQHLPPEGDIHLFHTVAQIKVRPGCSYGFEEGCELRFRHDLDELNFVELSAGVPLGRAYRPMSECLLVRDERGADVTSQFVGEFQSQLLLMRDAMPSMFTRDIDVIRQDCLGYLMERLPDPQRI